MTTTMFLQIERTRYEVASLKQASEMYCAAIKRSGRPPSHMPRAPVVFDARGQTIGHIAYNGRIFSDDSWSPESVKIFDPDLEQADGKGRS